MRHGRSCHRPAEGIQTPAQRIEQRVRMQQVAEALRGEYRHEGAAGTMHLRAHKTKITATIGPASSSPSVMGAMIQAGLDIARLNFSHGEFDDHRRNIESLGAAAHTAARDLAILADLPGPKIRLGTIEGGTVDLVPGQ